MPHRKLPDLEQLEQSLNLPNNSKPKQLILCGDFNCPDIQWETLTVPSDPNVQNKNVKQKLINLMSENNLTQVHDQPTRNGKLLDLVFTTNPSLIKFSVSIPGISDHDIVVTDADIKPIYTRQKPRKVYKWKQANWENIKANCETLTKGVLEQAKGETDIEDLWDTFKGGINTSVEKNVPSKICKNKYSLPWVNRRLKKSVKTKARLHKRAKKSGKLDRYRKFQKECKKQFRQAEYKHINSVIQEGLDNNYSKPFWKYVKCRKQDNIGVSPLKQKGNLISDSKSKADILVEQFQSEFTKLTDSIMPNMSNRTIPKMDEIVIDSNGVEKLLSNLKTFKSVGPDSIPNLVLKSCAKELSVGLSTIFQFSIGTGSLPTEWRDANISHVFKKGDKHLAENYRPVSLTSISCKLSRTHFVQTNS